MDRTQVPLIQALYPYNNSYSGQGPNIPDNSVFYSPGQGMGINSQGWSTASVIQSGLSPNQVDDFISKRGLTNFNAGTGTQAASSIDNAALVDRLSEADLRSIQAEQMATTAAVNNLNTTMQELPDKMTIATANAMTPANSLAGRWSTFWGNCQGKFPFSLFTSTQVSLSSSSESILEYPGYQLAPGYASTPSYRPLEIFGGLGQKVRNGAGFLVYAVTIIFIIRRVATI